MGPKEAMTQANTEKQMFNTDGNFANPKDLRRAKILNVAAGSMGMLWFALCLGSYFQLFARALGAGTVAIGLLATIPSLAHVFQIVSAYIVERLGRRKPYWATVSITRRMLLVLIPLLPFVFTPDHYPTAVTLMLVILAVSSILGSAGFAPWYSWMADIIPERERGRFFGRRMAIVNLSIVIFLPLFGRVLDSFPEERRFYGFAIVFGAGAALGLADIITHSFIPEPPMRLVERKMNLLAMARRPFKDANFRRFFFGWGLWSFATFITVPFYAVYYRENLEIDFAFLGTVTSITLLATVVASSFWGGIADRLGSKPVFNLCVAASIPIPVLFFFATPHNARVLLACQAVYAGTIASGMNIGFTNLLLGLSPREGRPMFVAVFFSVTGILTAAAPIIGGYIASNYDTCILGDFTRYHNLMLISMTLYLFSLPFFLRIREVHSAPMGTVLGSILMTNPVRTFARIGVLNAGRSVRASAQAVRALGAQRARLATEDLLARIDDPSVLVREEAVNALGEIGDPAAVPALLDRLETPEAHSTLGIIRALGMIGDKQALWPLVKCLEDEDRHLRAAAARALGEMRAREAVKALTDLVARERNQQVIANAIEALGEIGAAADMWNVLPLLKDIHNPILKRQTALAVGNLLGKRDEFYQILSKEIRTPGSEVERLTKRLLKHIGKTRTSVELQQVLRDFRDAYEAGDCRGSVALLWEAGYLIARDAYKFEGPSDALLEVAVIRDERFAAGLWFLHVLRSGEIAPSMDDALLGLYLLASGKYADAPRFS